MPVTQLNNPHQMEFTWTSFVANSRVQLILIAYFAIMFLFTRLGEGGLANFDDCYYAEKAKEILLTGDWLTLHYDGQPRFDNVPLFMWLMAIMFKFFGISTYTAKFFSALSGVGVVILVYLFAKYLYDHWVGFFSSFFMLTTPYFLKYSRHAMIDTTLAFFFMLSLLFFLWALKGRYGYFLLFGLAVGLSILLKSILGTFPIVIAILYLVLTRQWRIFRQPLFWAGIGVTIVVAAPWFIYEYVKYGQDFIRIHFVWLIYERAFVQYSESRRWYSYLDYLRILWIDYWPWIPLVTWSFVISVRDYWHSRDQREIFLIIWIVVVVGIMSLANEKKTWYLTSAFPAFSLIAGRYVTHLFSEKLKILLAKSIVLVFFVATVVIVAFPIPLGKERSGDIRGLVEAVKANTQFREPVLNYKLGFWGHRNSFLFYTDRSLARPAMDVKSFKEKLQENPSLTCLTSRRYFHELQQHGSWQILKKSGSLVYFKRKFSN